MHDSLTKRALLLVGIALLAVDATAARCDESFSGFLDLFTTDGEFAKTRYHRNFEGKERLLETDGRTKTARKISDDTRVFAYDGRAYPDKGTQDTLGITIKVGLSVVPDVRIVTQSNAQSGDKINYGFRQVRGCWQLFYKEFLVTTE